MIGVQTTYLVILVIVACLISYFQYYYRAKSQVKYRWFFALLRFLTLCTLGLLFLGVQIKKQVLTDLKPNLIIAIDNSKSITLSNYGSSVKEAIASIEASDLSSSFNVEYYNFGEQLALLQDSMSFFDKKTDITKVLKTFKETDYQNASPLLLITDGNQTYGSDYVTQTLNYKNHIYPVVVGDSVLKEDLSIKNVQYNKYSFLKNKFPVEITVDYEGLKSVQTKLNIYKNQTKVFSKLIEFDNQKSTQVVNALLSSNQIGRVYYRVEVESLSNEENIKNNSRPFSIDVIDERTNVLILSNVKHPDIGTLKKAIESNKQRKVFLKTTSDVIDYNNYQLVVLYQPDSKFEEVFKNLNTFNKNYLLVSGLSTDWQTINSSQNFFKKETINTTQEYLPLYNSGFTNFQDIDVNFTSYPPLIDWYGDIEFNKPISVLLYQKINALETTKPLFGFIEDQEQRYGLIAGEGLWKWRAKTFLNTESFNVFDELIGKTVQYLASNTKRERLVLNVENEYLLGDVIIKAQYFDKNFVLDSNEVLTATITNTQTEDKHVFNFVPNKLNYQLNASNLEAGTYSVFVKNASGEVAKSSTFTVLDFDIEAQFINPDVTKLKQVATNTKGKLYYLNQINNLINNLKTNDSYKTIQKQQFEQSYLIDWQYLLGILLSLLGIEWFLRKYNGLI